ncbi:MFS family permease [Alkalibacillus flavidus]|uniref:MFS family permease n=1 Tax=Alkalibacillus flavidus TaxID=546021 RepID=A0ABV2KWW2_9BACI
MGRTGSESVWLVYSLLFGLSLLQIGFMEWLRVEKRTMVKVSLVAIVVAIPFLMMSQFVSLLDLAGEVGQDVIYNHVSLWPVGALSLGFPVGLLLLGVALFKDGHRRGIGLSLAAVVMASGLVIEPFVHHIGIMLVSVMLWVVWSQK